MSRNAIVGEVCRLSGMAAPTLSLLLKPSPTSRRVFPRDEFESRLYHYSNATNTTGKVCTVVDGRVPGPLDLWVQVVPGLVQAFDRIVAQMRFRTRHEKIRDVKLAFKFNTRERESRRQPSHIPWYPCTA
eukprot:3771218-Rhodomonas_salina.1